MKEKAKTALSWKGLRTWGRKKFSENEDKESMDLRRSEHGADRRT